MDSQHLLVPIKVQALVIDDVVIQRRGVIMQDLKYRANAGRWSPQTHNYQTLTATLTPPGPRPFYGGMQEFGGTAAWQLLYEKSAWPSNDDRGVYLHWV